MNKDLTDVQFDAQTSSAKNKKTITPRSHIPKKIQPPNKDTSKGNYLKVSDLLMNTEREPIYNTSESDLRANLHNMPERRLKSSNQKIRNPIQLAYPMNSRLKRDATHSTNLVGFEKIESKNLELRITNLKFPSSIEMNSRLTSSTLRESSKRKFSRSQIQQNRVENNQSQDSMNQTQKELIRQIQDNYNKMSTGQLVPSRIIKAKNIPKKTRPSDRSHVVFYL